MPHPHALRVRRGSRMLKRQLSDIVDPYEGQSPAVRTWSQIQEALPSLTFSLLSAYFSVALFAIATQSQSTVLVVFVNGKFGGSTLDYGYVKAISGLSLLLASVISAHFFDSYSVKFLLRLNACVTALSCMLVAVAPSLGFLYLSMLPNLIQQGISVSRVYVSHLADSSFLQFHLGCVTFAYTLGYVLGPYLGGLVATSFSLSAVPLLGVCCSLVSLACAVFVDDQDSEASESLSAENTPVAGSDGSLKNTLVLGLKACLDSQPLMLLFISKFNFTLGSSMLLNLLPWLLWEEQDATVSQLGMVVSFAALVGVLTDSFVASNLVDRFSDKTLLTTSAFISGVSTVICLSTASLLAFGVATSLTTAASIVHGVVHAAQLSEVSTDRDNSDAIKTLDVIMTSLSKIFATLLAVHTLTMGGSTIFGVLSILLLIASVSFHAGQHAHIQ